MPATIAMTLDLRGLTVALPVARTAVAMAGLGSGELIEVLTSDPIRSGTCRSGPERPATGWSSSPTVPAGTGSFFRNGDVMSYITEIPLMTCEEVPHDDH